MKDSKSPLNIVIRFLETATSSGIMYNENTSWNKVISFNIAGDLFFSSVFKELMLLRKIVVCIRHESPHVFCSHFVVILIKMNFSVSIPEIYNAQPFILAG